MTATTIKLEIATTEAELPAGVAFDSYRYSIKDAAGNEIFAQSSKETSITLPAPAAGTYEAHVENHTADGLVIGAAVTAGFTIDAAPAPTPQTFQSASTLTVTVS